MALDTERRLEILSECDGHIALNFLKGPSGLSARGFENYLREHRSYFPNRLK
jgi:hypothetical protein